ncbi:NAD-dependent epimerase/dehydratase family protein [Microbulbifer agarilyticus]|uniref:NAD-dependent epimerase/dehydratase family protein n=1 Tax=Microbulbifer agarilyticus TaxID=260552 RepID=UPI001C98173E|nr:NAD-dependent epimerase/dehydratase family protein [Microbulbifer agarilyticus]MBY6189176.1 NAD-dependent epimerase/dehydratase family protein [Microbulbifer agarilyticus]
MKVLILGGDGYLGWPTAMHFSSKGHEVAVLDNYMRRNLARETDMEILYQTPNLHERCKIWKEHSGQDIGVYIGDLCDWSFVNSVFAEFKPDTIIHYAEQPSAPYSMLNADTARLTLNNNIGATGNVIFAMKEHCPDAHLIKLGTMGEYGTPNIDIEEGWLEVEHKGRSQKFLYPRQAGSLYHTTKVMDTDLLWFYVRTWGLRVTDLMQGPVYGIFTDENQVDERLLPCFAYDEIFGTVLNRFVVQAVAGYPLTVYGKGGQTRGYLNIKDTLQCLLLAAENPADAGELKIYNQLTETFTVNELAEKVQVAGKSIGLDVEVKSIENPRKELEEHYYNPASTGLLELGLKPNFLTDDVLAEIMEKVINHKDAIDSNRIFRGVKWN